MAWLNFLDLRSLSVKEAEAVILPIPYEATTTYGAGTRQGPEAILAASRQVELWDEDYDWDPSAAIRLATAAPISDGGFIGDGQDDRFGILNRQVFQVQKRATHVPSGHPKPYKFLQLL